MELSLFINWRFSKGSGDRLIRGNLGSPKGLWVSHVPENLGQLVHFILLAPMVPRGRHLDVLRVWLVVATKGVCSLARVLSELTRRASAALKTQADRRLSAVVGFMKSCKTDAVGPPTGIDLLLHLRDATCARS